MTKVKEVNFPKPKPPKTTTTVCTTDGKPLHPDDQKALEDYIEYRKKNRNKPSITSTKGEK